MEKWSISMTLSATLPTISIRLQSTAGVFGWSSSNIISLARTKSLSRTFSFSDLNGSHLNVPLTWIRWPALRFSYPRVCTLCMVLRIQWMIRTIYIYVMLRLAHLLRRISIRRVERFYSQTTDSRVLELKSINSQISHKFHSIPV